MQGARYLRAQAELCLEIARQMSDGTLADGLRDRAAQHFARAVESEAQSGVPTHAFEPPPSNGSALVRRYFFPVDYDGITHEDETGEVFLTLDEAEAYAEVVARELTRNSRHSITVYLVDEDGDQLGRFVAGHKHRA